MTIDRHSRVPLHRQVAAALRRSVETGAMPGGTRLPSTRALAKRLGVSRNTVLTAYEELIAEGVLEGRRGSGTRVAGRPPVPRVPAIPDPRAILRNGHYPLETAPFVDSDGNPLMAVRTV